jgi:ABC-type multidrug transport system permease subunit
MERLLAFFLLFLVPGLTIFIAKVQIPWERVNLLWLMAVVFHIPLMLFFIAAILVEIMDRMRHGRP